MVGGLEPTFGECGECRLHSWNHLWMVDVDTNLPVAEAVEDLRWVNIAILFLGAHNYKGRWFVDRSPWSSIVELLNVESVVRNCCQNLWNTERLSSSHVIIAVNGGGRSAPGALPVGGGRFFIFRKELMARYLLGTFLRVLNLWVGGEKMLRSWMVYSPSKSSLLCFWCRLIETITACSSAFNSDNNEDQSAKAWVPIEHW